MSTLIERQVYFHGVNHWFVLNMVKLAVQNKDTPEHLQTFYGNLLSALQQAFNNQLNDLFVEGTLAMARFWETFGDYEVASVFHERCAQLANSDEAHAKALFHHSYICEKQGNYEKALSLCDEGLTLARHTKNKHLIVDLIWQLSRMEVKTGHIESGERLIEEGLQLAEKINYHERMGWLLNVEGFVADNFHADYEHAEVSFKRGISMAISSGNQELLGDLHLNLGLISIRRGLYKLAKSQMEKALTFARETGHREQICYVLLNLGATHANLSRDNLEPALNYTKQAMAIAREIGHQELLGMANLHAGSIASESKQLDLAASYFAQSQAYFNKIGNTLMMAGVMTELGKLYIASEQWDTAWEFYTEALAFIRMQSFPEFEGKALYGMAQAAQGRGNPAEAKRLGSESLALFQRIQNEHADEVNEWLASLPDDV